MNPFRKTSNPYHFSRFGLSDKLRYRMKNLNCFINYHRQSVTLDQEQQKDVLWELENHGIAILKNHIPEATLLNMQKEVQSALEDFRFNFPVVSHERIAHSENVASRLLQDDQITTYENLLEENIFTNSSDGETYDTFIQKHEPHILKVTLDKLSGEFMQTWLDESILKVIATYMKCIPKMTEAYIRRSFPSKYPYQNNHWHRDTNDHYKLLKVFFLLSDMTPTNGPFQYVRDTCNDFQQFNGNSHYVGVEESIENFPNRLSPSSLPAGSIIIADTRGLHKANLPQDSLRDLGYAVFFPCRPLAYLGDFGIRWRDFQKLSSFQRKFILPRNIIGNQQIKTFSHSI